MTFERENQKMSDMLNRSRDNRELSEDELDLVAGGRPDNPQRICPRGYICPRCKGKIYKMPGKCESCRKELVDNLPANIR